LPATNKKPTVLAMEEARRGLVPYTDEPAEQALAPIE
jgi:DNA-directed RNA polymerase subunit K/omega